jgi:magnesium and cobalt exporter, CNNM family
MVGNIAVDLCIFFLLLLVSAIVSAVDAALQSVSRTQLEDLSESGDVRAERALALKNEGETVRASSQVAISFLLIISVILLSPYISSLVESGVLLLQIDSGWMVNAVLVLVFLLFVLVIGSIYLVSVVLIARSLGQSFAVIASLRSAKLMAWLIKLIAIPRTVIIGTANILLRSRREKPTFLDAITSEEGLKDILEEGTKTGLIDQTEHELIESIFDFNETNAREIMIPRTEIVAVEINMTVDDILRTVLEEGFTRMPVFEESLDNIVGVIYAKDVLSLIQHPNLIILEDIMRPAVYVLESKPIPELLRDFQRKHQHLAIVVDEFGGTEGLITMEDILEEIVGEIQDEYDDEEQLVEDQNDGSIIVQARVNISEFNESSGFNLPESENYDTIGGFVSDLFGRIPEEGDEVQFQSISITVMEVDERRIVQVWFKRIGSENAKNQENG